MGLDDQQNKIPCLKNIVIQNENIDTFKNTLLGNRDFSFYYGGTTNSNKMPSKTKVAKVDNLATACFLKLILYI
jgi:hypothetical protein